MVPKFSNPHLSQKNAQLVSRAEFEASVEVPYLRSEVQDEDAGALASLEELIKRSLGDFQVGISSETEKEEGRERKRRKVEGSQLKEQGNGSLPGEEVISFRLFSSSTTLVSLKPKPAPDLKGPERAFEDDEEEARQRRDRANEVAVDFSWVVAESQKYSVPHGEQSKNLISVKLDAQFDLPNMLVTEIPQIRRNTPLPPLPSRAAPEKTRPSPHAFPSEKLACPVIPCQVQTDTKISSRQRRKTPRRRGKKDRVPRPPPSFWRPKQEMGGKAMGYAMGYEGSRPIPAGSVRQWRYRRDHMKKAQKS